MPTQKKINPLQTTEQPADQRLKGLEQKLERALGIPFTYHNKVEVLTNGTEIFPAMLQAIQEARRSVHFLTFVYWSGDIAHRFADALVQKAEQGVEVQVILDSFGAAFMPAQIREKLEASPAKVEWFRPIHQWKVWKTDNRTHRKILVCDGNVAFTGGVGIAEEWEGDARHPGEWRDTHVRIEGPSVAGLYAAFAENWIETGRPVAVNHGWDADIGAAENSTRIQVVRTSASVRWSDIMMLYQTLISMAQDRIRITTAYFNPDSVIVDLLKKRAAEGVTIDIMMPGSHTDKRVAKIAGEDSFRPLLDAGITLWYYQKTMLHAKIICIDDAISCIGSANFNHRSMLKDDEVNLVLLDPGVSQTLNKQFVQDLKECEKVDGLRWKNRSLFRRTLETATKLIKQQI